MIMKYAFLAILVLCSSLHGVASLVSAYFSEYPAFPAGWTKAPDITNWSVPGTNIAGGLPGELQLSWNPTVAGLFRFISPSFDTRKVHDMTLSFKYALSDYTTANMYKIGAQISTDGINWTTVWVDSSSVSIPAAEVSIPISFELGKSAATYIALFFQGDTNDINFWCVDDIQLTYNAFLGYGTWPVDMYDITLDIIVPDGYTLQLEAGTSLAFFPATRLMVYGRLLVNGTAGQEVLFTSYMASPDWYGIDLYTSNPANDSTLINHAIVEFSNSSGIASSYYKTRISNSSIRNNMAVWEGGGIHLYNFAIIENCDIYCNNSLHGGAAIQSAAYTNSIRYNRIYNNTAGSIESGVLNLSYTTANGIHDNLITNNYGSSALGIVICDYSSGNFSRNLIANNGGTGLYTNHGQIHVIHCDIVNNTYSGITTSWPLYVESSIIWGNGGDEIHCNMASNYLHVGYSCLEGGISGIYGSPLVPEYLVGIISGNPLFVSPTSGLGSSFDALMANWHLQDNSPCADAGNPASPHDADFSVEDIGLYPARLMHPILTGVFDVPHDQGHQVDVQWNRNEADESFQAGAFYSVWREGGSRSANIVYISDPGQITCDQQPGENAICLRDGDRRWYWLQNSPAVNEPEYGAIVPTLQDSSSTGTHAANYLVRYHNSIGYWASLPLSGYSVDNIPPYSPSRVEIAHLTGNNFHLNWDEVTEGGWEGNSYPEVNGITYKVYAGDTPDFVISPATYLQTTTNPYAVLNSQTGNRRFYKVIATDSE
jgi:hypothetical protein